jgi:hypothetical protein
MVTLLKGGATGTGAVERGRQLTQGLRQVHAVRGRLHRHAAASAQPGHGAHPLSERSVSAIKAVQAPDELGFESIDLAADVDQVRAEGVGGDSVE